MVRKRGERTPLELLAESEWRLRNLRAELYTEHNPERRRKLERNIEIRRAFIDKLRSGSTEKIEV